jgi:hypothetical protein
MVFGQGFSRFGVPVHSCPAPPSPPAGKVEIRSRRLGARGEPTAGKRVLQSCQNMGSAGNVSKVRTVYFTSDAGAVQSNSPPLRGCDY